ncbi:MAG: CAP domain-containing protein [Gemmataceae bacterium]|nr:CAP domain-containing protein [Gemmataceae bacterium]
MLRYGLWMMPLLGLVVTPARGEVIEQKFPSGKTRLKYVVDAEGRKDGSYEQFYPDGKPKLQARYQADKLDGPYASFHDNGKPHIAAAYQEGKLDGTYTELSAEGQKVATAELRAGKPHGVLTRYEDGKPILVQRFEAGVPVFGRTLEQLRADLAAINKAGEPKADRMAAERDAALRRLKSYRYLAGAPHASLVLDDELNKYCDAAARICHKIGDLDHEPKNPGLNEADYQTALKGTRSSNLCMGQPSLERAVDSWMDDSDPANRAHMGHRRWCLNPTMGKVGFGRAGPYSAMWVFDMSQRNVPDYDLVAYPARGHMPVEYFGPKLAWSVSFNPAKYRLPKEGIAVRVFELDNLLAKAGPPLKLIFSAVDHEGAGIRNCLAFQPEKVSVIPGQRYLVEIDGLQDAQGQKRDTVRYLVSFCRGR